MGTMCCCCTAIFGVARVASRGGGASCRARFTFAVPLFMSNWPWVAWHVKRSHYVFIKNVYLFVLFRVGRAVAVASSRPPSTAHKSAKNVRWMFRPFYSMRTQGNAVTLRTRTARKHARIAAEMRSISAL